jgi:hypothetical protein
MEIVEGEGKERGRKGDGKDLQLMSNVLGGNTGRESEPRYNTRKCNALKYSHKGCWIYLCMLLPELIVLPQRDN